MKSRIRCKNCLNCARLQSVYLNKNKEYLCLDGYGEEASLIPEILLSHGCCDWTEEFILKKVND